VWVALASGHLGSFDRSKCKGPLSGPSATGDHCPEGWSFYKYPGPGFAGIGDNSAEASYYTWVDQHNAVGLGNDVPISTANESDGFAALVDGKMVSLRVPYPLGFYAKGLDAALTIRNPVGRAEGCGRRRAIGRHGLKRAARACPRSPCTSRSVLTRWHTDQSSTRETVSEVLRAPP